MKYLEMINSEYTFLTLLDLICDLKFEKFTKNSNFLDKYPSFCHELNQLLEFEDRFLNRLFGFLIPNDALNNYCLMNDCKKLEGAYYLSENFRSYQVTIPSEKGKNLVLLEKEVKESFWSYIIPNLKKTSIYQNHQMINLDFSACHLNVLRGLMGVESTSWEKEYTLFINYYPNKFSTFTIKMFSLSLL